MAINLRNWQKGFTLTEISVVIIIIGVLAAAAVPAQTYYIKRMTAREGQNILMALYSAQQAHKIDFGGYTAAIGNLEVEIPAPRYFNVPTVGDGSGSYNCGGPAVNWVAGVNSVDADFSLWVLTDGRIICLPCGGVTCQSIGIPNTWN